MQLIYHDGIEGRAGADQIRLVANYSGPAEAGFVRTRSALSANATWSHAMTDRLSAVLSASHLFGAFTSTVSGPDAISRTESRSPGPRVSLALTYGLAPARR